MQILSALLPIVAALLAGYVLGRLLKPRLAQALLRCLSPLVWALLFLIGFKFGAVILSAQSMAAVLKLAFLFSLCSTIASSLLLFCAKRWQQLEPPQARQPFRWYLIWPPLKQCLIALGMVALGSVAYLLRQRIAGVDLLPSSDLMLLALIVLVGIDLAQTRLDVRWLSPKLLLIPLLVLLGSLCGGVIAAAISGERLATALALSSGFGWFTLSSAMIGAKLGQVYGSVALLTDLLRELLGIVLLYTLGRRQPQIGIGSAGAAAMDVALPIIRQVCAFDALALALASGLVLSLLAPLLISALLSWAL